MCIVVSILSGERFNHFVDIHMCGRYSKEKVIQTNWLWNVSTRVGLGELREELKKQALSANSTAQVSTQLNPPQSNRGQGYHTLNEAANHFPSWFGWETPTPWIQVFAKALE